MPGSRAELPGDQGGDLLSKERKGEKNRRDVGMQLSWETRGLEPGMVEPGMLQKTCKTQSKKDRKKNPKMN